MGGNRLSISSAEFSGPTTDWLGAFFSLHSYRKRVFARLYVLAFLFPGLLLWTGTGHANPRGGQVVHGDVSIHSRGGNILDIEQRTANAIINWEEFSIDSDELTRFQQPSANAAVLNRVTGGNPTAIHGALRANGNVFVINPNGILVGAGGTIDVHGLVLSTLDVSNGEFLAGGDMVFAGSSGAGVTNLGRVNAIGGDVFLIGKTVSNSGTISARNGTVGLAAGEEVLLKETDSSMGDRVFVRATGSGVSGTGVFNDGTIEGAAVELKAHGNLYALAINNKGSVRATEVSGSGGSVRLSGIGGSVSSSGSIRVSAPSVGNSASALIAAAYAKVDGEIYASGRTGGLIEVNASREAVVNGEIEAAGSDGIGGSVVVEAETVTVGASASIDVSGTQGGGSVKIGGGFQGQDESVVNATSTVVEAGSEIVADATSTGNGGTVIVWADENALFEGKISARGIASGGFVEVSGKDVLGFHGEVSTLAANGTAGILLLDPRNGEISSAAHDPSGSPFNINNGTLQTALASNNVIVSTLDGGTMDAGNLSVNDQVIWDSAFSLTLLAEGDVYLADNIANRGAGNINIVAGWDSSVAPLGVGDASFYSVGSDIDMETQIFGVDGAFGNDMGSVYVGSRDAPEIGADNEVMVGSRLGQTNVAGYDVNVWSSPLDTDYNPRKFSQIGYARTTAGTSGADPISGEIHVEAVNDISLIANRFAVGAEGYPSWGNSPTPGAGNQGYNAYAQIGHGGREALRTSNMSGDITLVAGRDITAQAGLSRENYAIVGHGGYDNKQADATAVIGAAEINVTAGRDISFAAGRGGTAFAQLGHGGATHDLASFTESAINVSAGGDLSFYGGSGSVSSGSTSSYALLGHGGNDSDFDVAGQGYMGDISVLVGGQVLLQGGDQNNNYAMIGNGGLNIDGNAGGAVDVTAGNGGIMLTGGSSTNSFVQIGSGGYNFEGDLSGDTIVETTGADGILLQGGDGSNAQAVIGHGNFYGSTTVTSGDVTVTVAAGGITANASTAGYFAGAGIGHLGRDNSGNKSGTIEVTVMDGDISLIGGEAFGSSRYNSAQIGHGGYGNGVTGNASADIFVTASNGAISIDAGENYGAYAQIGHGGFGAGTGIEGDFNGNIAVTASGDIEIRSGDQPYTFARIGHGGRDTDGNMGLAGESIRVISETGNLELEGISGGDSIAHIGHGDLNDSDGTRQGDILVDVAGEISLVYNPNPVWIGHRTTDAGGLSDSNVTIRAGSLDFTSGVSGGDTFQVIETFDSMVIGNLAGGDVTLVDMGTGGISMQESIDTTSSFDLNILSHSDIFVADEIINRGEGNVNLVAGWDPSVSDLSSGSEMSPFRYYTISDIDMDTEIFDVAGAFGSGGGSVFVGVNPDMSGADRAVVVASRDGQTNVAGYDVNVWGGAVTGGTNSGARKYSQIGFNAQQGGGTSASGRIRVGAENDVDVRANFFAVGVDGALGWTNQDQTGYASHAQIGHGGERTSIKDKDLTGDIMVEAGGDLNVVGGITFNNHAMVGHGGYDNPDDNDGNNLARLGGDITVDVDGNVSLQSGSGFFAHSKIGHGGYNHFLGEFVESDISIMAGGNVSLTGGPGTGNSSSERGMAQIGHGGYNADFIEIPGTMDDPVPVSAGSGRGYTGNITVAADGSIAVTAGGGDDYNYAVVGHGGVSTHGDHSGMISVTGGTGVTVQGTTDSSGGSGNFAQIGHVMYSSEGVVSGDVEVTATTGGVQVLGGARGSSYALIGNGGTQILDGTVIGGATTVNSLGTNAVTDGITVLGGEGSHSYAAIGHGATRSTGGTGGHPSMTLTGDTTVHSAAGDILVQGGTYGYFSTGMIGHGGRDVDGDMSGMITVSSDSGDILVIGGLENTASNYNSAQIGHGGYGNGLTKTYSGDISVLASDGAIAVEGGVGYGVYAQIGHGGFGGIDAINGDASGSIRVEAMNDISLLGGDAGATYARVGHGGQGVTGSIGDADDTIEVISHSGGLEMFGGVSTSSIGNGDISNTGERKGDILVDVAGEISVAGNANLVRIGHRTATAGAISDADVTIRARSLDYSSGDSGGDVFAVAGIFGSMMEDNLLGGHVSLVGMGSGGLWVDDRILQDSGFDLNLLSFSDVYVSEDVINQGSGDINVVAGWDPSSADLSPDVEVSPFRYYWIRDVDMDTQIFGVPGSHGNGEGSVWVGANADLSAADTGVVLGSRTGGTNVAGYDVNVWGGALTGGINDGSEKYSQIGYNRVDAQTGTDLAVTGRIRVATMNDLFVEANHYAVGTLGYGGWTNADRTGYASYAQIGHGGERGSVQDMDLTGDIVVEVGNDIIARGGQTRENYAMIGHGGYDNIQSTSARVGGDITVTAGNDFDFEAGQGLYAQAQIGHVGVRHTVADFVDSDISVTAGGDIHLTGVQSASGNNRGSYAKIGHGGYQADVQTAGEGYVGNIDVHADGTVVMTSGVDAWTFAQIGHGGYTSSGNHEGDICVVGVGGVSLIATVGTGDDSFVQIGHGGNDTSGDFTGDITVTSSNGAVTLSSGNDLGRFTQIGHGGSGSSGEMTGEIKVAAGNGDLTLTGGAGDEAYAMVGHGDGAGTSSGQRGGGVQLFSSGALSASSGSGTGAGAFVFHQNSTGLQTGDYLGGLGFQLVGNGGISLEDAAVADVQTMIGGNIGSGPISLAIANDVDITIGGPDIAVNSSDGFYVLTGGSLTMLSSYQNSGSGDVTLVAGWDGTGLTSTGSVDFTDPCDPVISPNGTLNVSFTCDSFGNSGGVLTIGSESQVDGVAIGSKDGLNTFAGAGIMLSAGDSGTDSFSQLGYRPTAGGMGGTGDIEVHVKGSGLTFNSGDADGAFTQIGHGGYGSVAGDVVEADVTVSFCEPGDLTLNSGGGLYAYSMLGHGGAVLAQSNSGDLSISNVANVTMSGGDGERAYSQIGFGGYDADGTHSGSISIDAINSVAMTGGFGVRASVQIGHGGHYENGGANSGDIHITTSDSGAGVSLVSGSSTVGSNTLSSAHIGHGGYQAHGTHSGDIVIDTAGGFSLSGGNRDLNYKLVGHGGRNTNGTASGAINVTAAGDVDLIAGTNDWTFAQVGHGGGTSSGDHTVTAVGTIGATDGIRVITTNGDIRVVGGRAGNAGADGRNAYAQIGLGGVQSSGDVTGDIYLSATDGIDVIGGGRDHNYAMIGHGGDRASGMRVGDIFVETTGGDIDVEGGLLQELSVGQIGHGGFRSGSAMGAIEVHAHAGTVTIKNGGGDDDGDLGHFTVGDHSFSSGQIGHGGPSDTLAAVTLSGEICVVGLNGVELSSERDGDKAYSQIGHGGYNLTGDFDGDITVVAPDGSVTITGGSGGAEGEYAQIGHGGVNSNGSLSGDVNVVAGDGDMVLTGGAADNSYAMIGHGDGAKTSGGTREGGVHLFASGQLNGTNGSGTGSDVFIFHQNSSGLQPGDYLGGDGYQKVANGGTNLPGSALVDETTMINGNIGAGVTIFDTSNTDYVINGGDTFVSTSDDFYIVTGGNITMLDSYQNEGNGSVTLVAGWDGSGTATPGSVSYTGGSFCDPVVSNPGLAIDFNNCDTFGNGGATVTLGSATETAPVIVGSAGGTTTVAAHGLNLHGSDSSTDSFAQLGYRPTATEPNATGAIDIHVKSGGVTLDAGAANGSFTQIGHGGTGGTGGGLIAAPISITFCDDEVGDVSLLASSGTGSYAHIGHGGNAWSGDKQGAILIDGANDVVMSGGGANSYAQVGHGGAGVSGAYGTGESSGSIEFLDIAGDVTMTGGNAGNSYSQIGHGGVRSSGYFAGNVSVAAGGSITGTGGSSDGAYIQIGHGGRNVTSTAPSSFGSADIHVDAGEDVILMGGDSSYTHAKIGHSASLTIVSSFEESDISVSAGRNIQLISPQYETFTSNSYSNTQIGHGGVRASVDEGDSGYSGDIDVSAGGKIDVIASRNARTYNYSQIGHVTYFNTPGIHSGDIDVVAGTQEGLAEYGLNVIASSGDYNGAVNLSNGYYSYAAIGHQGHGGNFSLTGDIDVDVVRGGINVIGGTGVSGTTSGDTPSDIRLHPAQIGHGGYNVTSVGEGIHGSVRVSAQGDILLEGNSGPTSPVYIGHGGYSADGAIGKEGDEIVVISREGNLELRTNGSVANNIVMIGNGSSTGGSGTRMGDILIDVAGEISTAQDGTPVWLGHRTDTAGGISNADVTIRASSFDTVTGVSGSDVFELSGASGSVIAQNMSGGHVTLIDTGSGGIWFNSSTVGDSSYDLNLLSETDVFISNDAINRGSGDVNIVAGWDPAVEDFSSAPVDSSFRYYWIRDIDMDTQVFDVAGAYANGGAGVWIGANADLSGADTGVVVASRLGQTNVVGQDVNVWGGAVTGGLNTGHRYYSQIGYNRIDGGTGETLDATGRIRVQAVDEVYVEANHYAVGTVGYGGWTDQDRTGQASFAQIGHGGERTSVHDMTLTGDIIVEAGGDVRVTGGQTINNHARIGHGGYDNPDDNDGTNNAMLGGEILVDAGGNVTFQAGQGYYAYAQLGHGGSSHYMGTFIESDITLNVGGDVAFIGGPGNMTGNTLSQQAYAQLGHGGYNADFIETPGTMDDAVPVSAGSGRGYAGNISVTATGSVSVLAGGGDDYNYATIGNGGAFSNGDHSGDIHIQAGTGVLVDGGDSNTANFAQIGHVGYLSEGDFDGDICIVTSTGDVVLEGGAGSRGYAQIGSGGDGVTGDMSGDIQVGIASGNLSLTGGSGTYADATIGHGASDITGTQQGDVLLGVSAGTVTLVDGSSGLARLGHLGDVIPQSDFALITGTLDVSSASDGLGGAIGRMGPGGAVDIGVLNGDLTIDGGSGAFLNHAFDVDLFAGGDVNVLTTILNGGNGSVSAIAGWDGVTGLIEVSDYNSCPVFTTLDLDAASVLADPAVYGNATAVVNIGDGTQTQAAVVGSAGGTTNV
ncbi:MAG: hypothetical protein CMO55_14855, partial [Verrucomicrobiales bacterium]|nr:hypothetical protein [Verrucomicrobiales bacterium]